MRILTDRAKKAINKHWSDNDKLKVVSAYVLLRNASRVEEITGVPAGTINYWKTLPWWEVEEAKVRRAQAEETVSRYHQIVKKTQELIMDRLEIGDTRMTKDGALITLPVPAKDLAVINGVAIDKQKALEREIINMGSGDLTMTERLKALEEKFKKVIEEKTIEGEVLEIKTTEVQSGEEAKL